MFCSKPRTDSSARLRIFLAGSTCSQRPGTPCENEEQFRNEAISVTGTSPGSITKRRTHHDVPSVAHGSTNGPPHCFRVRAQVADRWRKGGSAREVANRSRALLSGPFRSSSSAESSNARRCNATHNGTNARPSIPRRRHQRPNPLRYWIKAPRFVMTPSALDLSPRFFLLSIFFVCTYHRCPSAPLLAAERGKRNAP